MLLKLSDGQKIWLRNDFDLIQAMSDDVLSVKHVFRHRKEQSKTKQCVTRPKLSVSEKVGVDKMKLRFM